MTAAHPTAAAKSAGTLRWLYTVGNLTRLPGRQAADQEWRAFSFAVYLGTKSRTRRGAARAATLRADPAARYQRASAARRRARCFVSASPPLMSHPACKIPVARWTAPCRQEGQADV